MNREDKSFEEDRTPGSCGSLTPIKGGDWLVYPGATDQGFIYKDALAFQQKTGGICYIPEHGFDDAQVQEGGYLLSTCEGYTYQEFLEACGGNERVAEHVFANMDWQSPGTYYDEMTLEEVAETMSGVSFEDHVILDFCGTDGWDRPVYQVIRDYDCGEEYIKDVSLGRGGLQLYWSYPKDNADGEPDFPFSTEKGICFLSTRGLPLPTNADLHNRSAQEEVAKEAYSLGAEQRDMSSARNALDGAAKAHPAASRER